MKYGLKDSDIQKMSKIFRHFSDIKKVIIFGSRALGNYKKGSDVDIALIGNLNADTLMKFKRLLEETNMPYFFDVVDYNLVQNPEFKKHIDKFGLDLSFNK